MCKNDLHVIKVYTWSASNINKPVNQLHSSPSNLPSKIKCKMFENFMMWRERGLLFSVCENGSCLPFGKFSHQCKQGVHCEYFKHHHEVQWHWGPTRMYRHYFHNTTLPQNEWFISTSDLNPSEDTTISVIDSNITMGHGFMNSDTITT